MKRILFVTKDGTPFRALEPLKKILQAEGHACFVVAEGISLRDWKTKAREWEILWYGEEKPKPMDQDVIERIFSQSYPDVVVVGLSSPINAEDQFASEANRREIPLATFSDTWGATSRMKCGIPDLILTLDNLDAKIAEGHFPASRVVPVGDWITKPAVNPRNPWARNMKSLFIAGQNPATIKDFVVETITRIDTTSNWQVAFRPHPKYKDAPETLKALSLLEQHGVKILKNTEVSGDELATTADITVSSFSGALRVSALAGKVAVSIQTSNCMAQMEKSTGLKVYPLVELGACIKVDAGSMIDFGDLLHVSQQRERRRKVGQYRESLLPHSERAIREILALAGN